MALANEDLQAIAQLLDLKLQPVSNRIDSVETRIGGIETRIDSVETRIDSVEAQVKQTEQVLKNEIRKECSLVLDEVERVHDILDKHKADTTKHTA